MSRAPHSPLRFREAVAWFKARVPMLKGAWEKLEERLRRRAFTVAGVAQLDLVTALFRAIDKAVEDGEDLTKFRERVGEKLTREWGVQTQTRLELVFRNNVQDAYSAGRWRQMTEPAMLRVRPYGRFSAILDGRETKVCHECDGTILLLTNPWWRGHYPLLHHRCRSVVIGMTAAEAKAAGVTAHPPKVEAQPGFGQPPDDRDLKPDLSAYPKPLVQTFRRKYKG